MSKSEPIQQVTKRKRRPTKYKPEYCEMFVDAARKGETIEMFADSIDVHTDTLHEWAKVNPEFSVAFKKAKQAAHVFMQKLGVMGVAGKQKGFAQNAWIFWMAARHGWRKEEDNSDPVESLDFE